MCFKWCFQKMNSWLTCHKKIVIIIIKKLIWVMISINTQFVVNIFENVNSLWCSFVCSCSVLLSSLSHVQFVFHVSVEDSGWLHPRESVRTHKFETQICWLIKQHDLHNDVSNNISSTWVHIFLSRDLLTCPDSSELKSVIRFVWKIIMSNRNDVSFERCCWCRNCFWCDCLFDWQKTWIDCCSHLKTSLGRLHTRWTRPKTLVSFSVRQTDTL